MLPLTEFLESLFDNGRVKVVAPDELESEDRQGAQKILKTSEAIWRLDQPAGLPEFDIDAALWAAEVLFRAAQFQVFRDVDPGVILVAFGQPGPDVDSPSAHYSVDLCFQFIGEVLRQSTLASSEDPLNEGIVRVLKSWPLSTIGVKDVEPPERGVAFLDRPLWRMFVDRAIATDDQRLLNDPQIQKSVAVAVGAFPELVPAFQKQLKDRETSAE